MLSIEEIQRILPHRYPFLLIDRIIEHEPGKKVVALKNVSINEGFFGGHFPDSPVMPGVLLIEAMAQASILLFYAGGQAGGGKPASYYLGAVKARFLQPVYPGDQARITVEPIKLTSGGGIVAASVVVGNKECARGELTLGVKEGNDRR